MRSAGDARISVDQARENSAGHGRAQGQCRGVDQDNFLDGAVLMDDARLQSGSHGYDFIRVDVGMNPAFEDRLHELPHGRHPRLAADQQNVATLKVVVEDARVVA